MYYVIRFPIYICYLFPRRVAYEQTNFYLLCGLQHSDSKSTFQKYIQLYFLNTALYFKISLIYKGLNLLRKRTRFFRENRNDSWRNLFKIFIQLLIHDRLELNFPSFQKALY